MCIRLGPKISQGRLHSPTIVIIAVTVGCGITWDEEECISKCPRINERERGREEEEDKEGEEESKEEKTEP